jgi:hypothetical protein
MSAISSMPAAAQGMAGQSLGPWTCCHPEALVGGVQRTSLAHRAGGDCCRDNRGPRHPGEVLFSQSGIATACCSSANLAGYTS